MGPLLVEFRSASELAYPFKLYRTVYFVKRRDDEARVANYSFIINKLLNIISPYITDINELIA
jgi:hypothetical protein